MLSIYDLYDLSAILKTIRSFPGYKLNREVILKVITVLEKDNDNYSFNQFRVALRSIPKLHKEKYYYAYTDNLYVYFPRFLKNGKVYNILISCFKRLLMVVEECDYDKTVDLADCLHNLPILIAENNFTVPKIFWQIFVNPYRNKWDMNFLCAEQKANQEQTENDFPINDITTRHT